MNTDGNPLLNLGLSVTPLRKTPAAASMINHKERKDGRETNSMLFALSAFVAVHQIHGSGRMDRGSSVPSVVNFMCPSFGRLLWRVEKYELLFARCADQRERTIAKNNG